MALGDDPDREGLKETPDRVARMYEEVFEGMNYTNHEIAKMFNKTFNEDAGTAKGSDDMVIVRDIDIFSYCEHHLAKLSVLARLQGLPIWSERDCSFRRE